MEKSDFTVQQSEANSNTLTALLRGESQQEEEFKQATPKSGTQVLINEEGQENEEAHSQEGQDLEEF